MPRPFKVFCSPERYVQGRGVTNDLGVHLNSVGLQGPLLIVAANSARRLLTDTWKTALGSTNFEYYVHPFGGECTEEEIDAIVDLSLRHGCHTIIGSGGGKVIDAARAAASKANVKVVSAPTVASTDAPCSALSVVYKPDGTFSNYLFYKRHPDLVLVDTEVIASAPRRTLVGGLGDALATWFEARTVRETCSSCTQLGGLPTVTGTALAKLCYDILIADGPAACLSVDCQACTPALERVVEANTLLSGLGFENGGLAIAHSLHNGLTRIPACHEHTHGEKVAFGLAAQLIIEGRPQEEIQTVMRYCDTVGLPITLDELGVDVNDEDALRWVAEGTIAPGESSHNEPFEVTVEMVRDGMVTAHYNGVRYRERKEGV